MKSVNPFNNQLIAMYQEMEPSFVTNCLRRADEVQRQWQNTPLRLRSDCLRTAASILRDRNDEFAQLITTEMGKPIRESRAEVDKCAWVCDYYAEMASDLLDMEFIESDAGSSYVRFDPLGVVLAVMPWNFPFWQVFRFAAPALMAGNGGLLKHASNVQGCAVAIHQLFLEAGFPEGLFQTLIIGSDQVADVIQSPAVKAVTLTGSEAAGASVAAIAGKQIKKSVLELGGSDPFIVLGDADLAPTLEGAILSRFMNGGQSCIAAKRFIVEQSILEDFTSGILKKMTDLAMGDPLDETNLIGPLARRDLVDELHDQVVRSVALGANVLTGGEPTDSIGCFYPPTLLTDVKPGMPAFDEELFGPVLPIISAADEVEAIAAANQSRYGLGASIWTSDVEKAKRLAGRLESGSVFINGIVKSDPRLPFGGIKLSGYGRELSRAGIREFVNMKTVWIR